MKHSFKCKFSVIVLAAVLLVTSLIIPATASAAQSDSASVSSSYAFRDQPGMGRR